MSKVRISKAQAEALEHALEYGKKESIVEWRIKDIFSGNTEQLNKLPLDVLCKALYVGYEVDKGPEEKATEIFFCSSVPERKQILLILKALEINLKGVNC
ncbi:hypothetical protein ACT8ZR_09060 [Neobacillus sp. M.A.Huq-85]